MQLKIAKGIDGYIIYNPAIAASSLSTNTRMMLYRIVINFCREYNSSILFNENKTCFETEEEAKKALEWIESRMLIEKLIKG